MSSSITLSKNQLCATVAIVTVLFAIVSSPTVYVAVGGLVQNLTGTQLVQKTLPDQLDMKLVVVHSLLFGLVTYLLLQNVHRLSQ